MAKSKEEKIETAPPSAQMATAQNDITIPFYSDILSPMDDTLIHKGGIEGLKIYDDLERDNHCFSVLQKRKRNLIAREWEVRAGGEGKDDIAAADFIRDVFSALPFDQICEDFLDATLKGYATSEIDYGRDGRHVTIDRIRSIEQRRIVFDMDWKPRLLTLNSPMNGEKLPERKFITHRVGVKGNNPYGIGAGTRLFWAVLFKKEGVAFWRRFLERFASPIPVGKYPVGTDLATRRALDLTLQLMNQASSITVPYGTELETFESKRTGTVDYIAWAKFWNAEISKGVTGETLTTEMGENGARAASETHSDILSQLLDGDGDLLSGTLKDTVIRWLCAYNYPNAALPSVWRLRPTNALAEEELKTKRAARRERELDALERGRELGYEPADLNDYMERVFDGPVKAVAPAQKKTLKSPSPMGATSRRN